jgi:hypothetical protein
MIRTRVRMQGMTFYLAQGRDPEDLKADMIEAVKEGGAFVSFVEVGNHHVSVLISPGVVVVFEEEMVDRDSRDTGDMSEPFDPSEDARSRNLQCPARSRPAAAGDRAAQAGFAAHS